LLQFENQKADIFRATGCMLLCETIQQWSQLFVQIKRFKINPGLSPSHLKNFTREKYDEDEIEDRSGHRRIKPVYSDNGANHLL
jgi:hypothetical protein